MDRIRYEANDFKFNNGYAIPVHVLAKRIADLAQIATQKASYRAMAVSTVLIGIDDEKGPQVFKLDAAGHYLPYKGKIINISTSTMNMNAGVKTKPFHNIDLYVSMNETILAVATGKLEAEAMNFLEKRATEFPTLDANGTIEMAISSMQYILSTDFKSNEIEVGIISMEGGNQKFRTLTADEIEDRLTAITEKADN